MFKAEYEFYYEQAFNQKAFELTGNTKHLFKIDETKEMKSRLEERIQKLKQNDKWDSYGLPN